jgi:hypothetical protein
MGGQIVLRKSSKETFRVCSLNLSYATRFIFLAVLFCDYLGTVSVAYSSVGIATSYGLDKRSQSSCPQLVRGKALFPAIKRPVRDSDHSTAASVEVQKTWTPA